MRAPALAAAVTAVVVAAPRSARADADEASIQVALVGGVAMLGEDQLADRDVAPLGGLAGTFTYAWRDRWALEVGVAATSTALAKFEAMDLEFVHESDPQPAGTLVRRTRAARVTVGPTLRLGSRIIGTLHLGAGAQLRARGAASFVEPQQVTAGAMSSEIIPDLVATARLGLDLRFHRRWVFGVAAGGVAAVPLGQPAYQAVEGTLQVAYYWYPLW